MKKLALLSALAASAFVATPAMADPTASMTKAGCMACHAKDKKLVGPSFQEIAAKYKGKGAEATLFEKVRKGGAGSFGPVPMAPNSAEKINDADLKAAIDFILKS